MALADLISLCVKYVVTKLIALLDSHKRNSQKKNVPYSLTKEQWNATKEHFNNCCAYCGKPSKILQQDHFIPLKLGGAYTQYNIVPACSSCNHRKSAKHPREWLLKNFENGEKVYKRISKYLAKHST